jgi:AAA domain-containing protein
VSDRSDRRPQLLLGAAGAGKTSVLVRLAQLLATRGVVPIAFEMSPPAPGQWIDLRADARAHFFEQAQGRVAEDEVEKLWRRLVATDRIVLLVDNLDEALPSEQKEAGESAVRHAFVEAHRALLPVIAASRPVTAGLWDIGAAVHILRPISPEAALEYLQADVQDDDYRLAWIVENVGLAESPAYLQVVRELIDHGRESEIYSRVGDASDRRGLRLRWTDRWMADLMRGYMREELPLSIEDREAAIIHLSAMACHALKHGGREVTFTQYEDPACQHPALTEAVQSELARIERSELQPRLAAARGTQLALVQTGGDVLRFPHSFMQSYLASRFFTVLADDPWYWQAALRDPSPELLDALVMWSRSPDPEDEALVGVQLMLEQRGAYSTGRSSIDCLALALQIDAGLGGARHLEITKVLMSTCASASSLDPTVEDAKRRAINRFGEAADRLAAGASPGEQTAVLGYRPLHDAACLDASDRVRTAAAVEIGLGGEAAVSALEDTLGPPSVPREGEEPSRAQQARRSEAIRALAAPLLILSNWADEAARKRAMDNLQAWVTFVSRARSTPTAGKFGIETALARGFKYASNIRPGRHSRERDAHAYLQQTAEQLLSQSRYWFSRVTLLHALCLWTLPESERRDPELEATKLELAALVARWLSVAGRQSEHPFVEETGHLIELALVTGQPERFIWLDESTVVQGVGSPAGSGRHPGTVWIPPSAGWATLEPRARLLAADVLILLNLAQRERTRLTGGRKPPTAREQDRRTEEMARDDLPPCLTGRWRHLRLVTASTADTPGQDCADGCRLELCPYPARGDLPGHLEFSEAFCRAQERFLRLRWPLRRVMPWHGTSHHDRRFWREMLARAPR